MTITSTIWTCRSYPSPGHVGVPDTPRLLDGGDGRDAQQQQRQARVAAAAQEHHQRRQVQGVWGSQ